MKFTIWGFWIFIYLYITSVGLLHFDVFIYGSSRVPSAKPSATPFVGTPVSPRNVSGDGALVRAAPTKRMSDMNELNDVSDMKQVTGIES